MNEIQYMPDGYVQRLRKRQKYYSTTNPDGPLGHYRWKASAKLIAMIHGLRVPQLLWAGLFRHIPWGHLPDRYVIKPDRGSSGIGVFLIDHNVNLLSGRELNRKSLFRHYKDNGVLIESMVDDVHQSTIPIDYKLFAFGAEVPAVLAIDRRGGQVRRAWFSVHWKPRSAVYNNRNGVLVHHSHFPRPPHLGEMVDAAIKITSTAQTHLRVDMYDSSKGAVFGETTLFPNGVDGVLVEADRELGELWNQTWGDAI